MPIDSMDATSTSPVDAPRSAIRPSPSAPPANEVRMPVSTPARTPEPSPRRAAKSQARTGCRRWTSATESCGDEHRQPIRPVVNHGVAPSSGSAANSGKAGTGPSWTTLGDTTVPVPTAKPGPEHVGTPQQHGVGCYEGGEQHYHQRVTGVQSQSRDHCGGRTRRIDREGDHDHERRAGQEADHGRERSAHDGPRPRRQQCTYDGPAAGPGHQPAAADAAGEHDCAEQREHQRTGHFGGGRDKVRR